MRTLKIYLYEIIAGLTLLGLSHVYLESQGLLPFAQVMLVALYVLIAAATEALIASSSHPEMRRLITVNVLVAAIVSASGWTSDSSLKVSASIGIGTLTLRALVADVSVRASKVQVRRITAAFVGGTLLLETLATVYGESERIYYDYYYYPKVKGYPVTIRWQDFVGHAVFLGATLLVFYLSYRLLKYAFSNKPAVPG
ncbi:MAG TPA: hypothetical protein VGJ30_10360 [Candidatus Angelobacter sp.]|jgi:hypothetical protein